MKPHSYILRSLKSARKLKSTQDNIRSPVSCTGVARMAAFSVVGGAGGGAGIDPRIASCTFLRKSCVALS